MGLTQARPNYVSSHAHVHTCTHTRTHTHTHTHTAHTHTHTAHTHTLEECVARRQMETMHACTVACALLHNNYYATAG